MTQTIEQLQAKNAELEKEVESLTSGIMCEDCGDTGWQENAVEGRYVCSCVAETEPYQLLEKEVARLKEEENHLDGVVANWKETAVKLNKKLAIAEEHNMRLISALVATRDDLELRMKLAEDDSLNISNSVLDQMLDAIDIPASREALDAYVAEKHTELMDILTDVLDAKEAMEKLGIKHDTFPAMFASLIRQRDLAVEVLKTAYEVATNHDDRLPFDWAVYCEMLWQAIKESEGM